MAKKAAKTAKEADKKPKTAAKAGAAKSGTAKTAKPAAAPAKKAPAKTRPAEAPKAVKPKKTGKEAEVDATEELDDSAAEVAADLESVDVPDADDEPAAPKAKALRPKKLSAKKEKAAAKAASDASESLKKWSDLKERHAAEKAAPYAMSARFEANTPLQHKVLGWGFILNNNNDRLEVLFESGVKILISNYKP